MSTNVAADTAIRSPAVDFMGLLGRCLGNFKMVERVLGAFREAGLADLQQLQVVLENCDFKTAAEIAHRFKGAAGNVSATELHLCARQMEALALEGNGSELNVAFERLQQEWVEFERFATAFLPAVVEKSRPFAGQ